MLLIVVPAQAGLRRQDAGANIGEADGRRARRRSGASSILLFSETKNGFRLYSRYALALRAAFGVRSLRSQSPE
ncbi:MAG: hypothetical protein V4567_11605 [Pseudomonadota bacterium]